MRLHSYNINIFWSFRSPRWTQRGRVIGIKLYELSNRFEKKNRLLPRNIWEFLRSIQLVRTIWIASQAELSSGGVSNGYLGVTNAYSSKEILLSTKQCCPVILYALTITHSSKWPRDGFIPIIIPTFGHWDDSDTSSNNERNTNINRQHNKPIILLAYSEALLRIAHREWFFKCCW